MSPWIFVLAAIAANVCLNLSLKALSGLSLQGNGSVLGLAARVLSQPAFWLAGVCGVTLIGCFILAIRSLPLSASYAAITGGAMAGLALFGLMSGTESLSLMRLFGLAMVIGGIVVMSQAGQG